MGKFKYLTAIDFHGDLSSYQVKIEKYKTNKHGVPYAVNNEVPRETLVYRF